MSTETQAAPTRPVENLVAELEWLRTRIGHISAAAERAAVEAEQLPGTTACEVARVFRVIAVALHNAAAGDPGPAADKRG